MLKDITFGQYYESHSAVHSLDPRIKLILLILLIVFLFLTDTVISLLLFCGVLVAFLAITRVPLKMYLKNIKAILPILIFTMVINAFYAGGGKSLLKFWVLEVTTGSLIRAGYMALRIVLLILVSAMLTYTTTPNDLTDGIERLLSPLGFIGLKSAVHTLAMMMTIALRFIPTLVEETEKIMNAQKARGADLESGNLMQRIRALIPILIPLLISSVRRAFELAEAMECRCYNGGEGRVRMKQMHLHLRDGVAALICVAACVGVIVCNRFGGVIQ